jgi:hypothetical protein
MTWMEAVSSSVYPSGADRATEFAPTLPPAPPARLSTMNVGPSVSPSFCARMRATPSTEPPAG